MATGSQAAYARYKDVSKQTVTDWKSRGLVVFTEDGKVDFDATDAALVKHGVRQPDSAESDVTECDLTSADAKWTKAEAERVKENYAALLKQLEYDLKSGAVVEIDDVVIAIASEYAVVRNKMLDVGTRVAPKAAVMKSAEEIKALIDAAVIEALEELSIDDGEETDFAALRESLQKRFGPTVEADAEVEE